MIDAYTRPYCERCKLTYGKKTIGLLSHCPKCGQQITFKSYNPWKTTFIGLGIIGIGCLTLIIPWFPIMWFGGFLLGGGIVYGGFKQWSDIQRLDDDKPKEKTVETDDSRVLITCGNCSRKLWFKKGQGVIKIRCPECKKEAAIRT